MISTISLPKKSIQFRRYLEASSFVGKISFKNPSKKSGGKTGESSCGAKSQIRVPIPASGSSSLVGSPGKGTFFCPDIKTNTTGN